MGTAIESPKLASQYCDKYNPGNPGQTDLKSAPSSNKCAYFDVAPLLQVKPEELTTKVTALQGDLKAANKEIEALRTQLTLAKSEVKV